MTEFESTAVLNLRLPDDEIQRIEQRLQRGALAPAVSPTVSGGPVAAGPGGADSLPNLAEERNEILRDIQDDLQTGGGPGGGGPGGGGGGLPAPQATGALALAGPALGLLGRSTFNSKTPTDKRKVGPLFGALLGETPLVEDDGTAPAPGKVGPQLTLPPVPDNYLPAPPAPPADALPPLKPPAAGDIPALDPPSVSALPTLPAPGQDALPQLRIPDIPDVGFDVPPAVQDLINIAGQGGGGGFKARDPAPGSAGPPAFAGGGAGSGGGAIDVGVDVSLGDVQDLENIISQKLQSFRRELEQEIGN